MNSRPHEVPPVEVVVVWFYMGNLRYYCGKRDQTGHSLWEAIIDELTEFYHAQFREGVRLDNILVPIKE